MRLIITRHGQTEWNILHRTQGMTDTKLAPVGILEAERFAQRVMNMHVDAVYASPLQRAFHTAEIISDACRVKVFTDDDLREINFGAWEGLTYPQIEENYPELLQIWNRMPEKCSIPKAEPVNEVRKRTERFIEKVLKKHSMDTVVLVSHSLPVKLIIAGAIGLPTNNIHNIRIENLSLNIIDYYIERPVLRVMNDISHLK